MLANQDRLPRRAAESDLLLAEVNAHVERLNDRSSHQHWSVSGHQVALDRAIVAIQHHRKIHGPASLR